MKELKKVIQELASDQINRFLASGLTLEAFVSDPAEARVEAALDALRKCLQEHSYH